MCGSWLWLLTLNTDLKTHNCTKCTTTLHSQLTLNLCWNVPEAGLPPRLGAVQTLKIFQFKDTREAPGLGTVCLSPTLCDCNWWPARTLGETSTLLHTSLHTLNTNRLGKHPENIRSKSKQRVQFHEPALSCRQDYRFYITTFQFLSSCEKNPSQGLLHFLKRDH